MAMAAASMKRPVAMMSDVWHDRAYGQSTQRNAVCGNDGSQWQAATINSNIT